MENVLEMLFDNRFFQLPFLEALSYIVGFLMVGAAIVSLPKRLMGTSSQPTEVHEEAYGEEWEWRKAA
jgi:hypothetical protein